MCGIAGIYHFNRQNACQEQALLAMRDVITHRGPDDSGIYIQGHVGIAHRRLSIIDLSHAGHQPMFLEKDGLSIVFNGEIYNYQSLKDELIKKGHHFSTSSDTEVIIHAYQEYKEACAAKLNGIFAFAIYDSKHNTIYAARDHIGVKPFYYYKDNQRVVFASEVKALFESGYVKAAVNFDAVPEYLAFRHVAGDRSLFANVELLLPGHYMIISEKGIEKTKYWDTFTGDVDPNMTFAEAAEQVETLLRDAVRMQMMSDVPLGTFCSGGVDSSLVTAIAAEFSSNKVKTFSVGFHEDEYDETRYARMVSERYSTDHHEIIIDGQRFSDMLPKMIWHNDDPLNFANSVQIYAVSELAKQHVTVVLTGEGADELFGGYPRYQIPVIASRIQALPGVVRKLASFFMSKSSDHRLKKLNTYLSSSLEEIMLYNTSSIGAKRMQAFYPRLSLSEFDYRYSTLMKTKSLTNDLLRRITLLDQNTYLGSILNRQDKMSMATSLESRVPILDYRLIELANTIPPQFKQKKLQSKILLKKIAEKYLPHDVIYRRKSGFGVPLADWFRAKTGLGVLAQDVFSSVNLDELETINIKNMLVSHQQGQADHAEVLWTVLNYALWKKTFNIA